MFKNFAMKSEEPDTYANTECTEDVKIEVEESIFDSEMFLSGLKSEDDDTPSIEIKTILPIEAIYFQEVSALVQSSLFFK